MPEIYGGVSKRFIAFVLLAGTALASERSEVHGQWRVKAGQSDSVSWFDPNLDDSNWDPIGPPSDGRSQIAHVQDSAHGPVWYRISFPVPALPGKSARLILDRAFDGARAWLNGQEFWGPARGNDMFETDVAELLRHDRPNVLAVCLEGAKANVHPNAYLWIGPEVFVSNQKVTAVPNMTFGRAEVTATVWITNATQNTVTAGIESTASRDAGGSTAGLTVSPGTTVAAELHWTIPPTSVHLWDAEHSNLYQLSTSLTAVSDSGDSKYQDSEEVTFGIRRIESRDGGLFLNGKALQSSGAKFVHIVAADTPLEFLASADASGLMLIESSSGNRSILRDMVTRDWNHPSIVGWSIDEKSDADFVRGLDNSRVVQLRVPK